MFAEALQKGLAAGGWAIGFIAALGAFLVLVGILGLALSYAVRGEDTSAERSEAEGGAKK